MDARFSPAVVRVSRRLAIPARRRYSRSASRGGADRGDATFSGPDPSPRHQGLSRAGLSENSVVLHEGIPVTSPAQTLIDLAARHDQVDGGAVRQRADRLRLIHRTICARRSTHTPVAFACAASSTDPPSATPAPNSSAPLPLARARVCPSRRPRSTSTATKSTSLPSLNLVVETDGLTYPPHPVQQAKDRERDQDHAAAGHRPPSASRTPFQVRARWVARVLRATALHLRRRGRVAIIPHSRRVEGMSATLLHISPRDPPRPDQTALVSSAPPPARRPQARHRYRDRLLGPGLGRDRVSATFCPSPRSSRCSRSGHVASRSDREHPYGHRRCRRTSRRSARRRSLRRWRLRVIEAVDRLGSGGDSGFDPRWYVSPSSPSPSAIDISRVAVSVRSAKEYKSARSAPTPSTIAGDTEGSIAVLAASPRPSRSASTRATRNRLGLIVEPRSSSQPPRPPDLRELARASWTPRRWRRGRLPKRRSARSTRSSSRQLRCASTAPLLRRATNRRRSRPGAGRQPPAADRVRGGGPPALPTPTSSSTVGPLARGPRPARALSLIRPSPSRAVQEAHDIAILPPRRAAAASHAPEARRGRRRSRQRTEGWP